MVYKEDNKSKNNKLTRDHEIKLRTVRNPYPKNIANKPNTHKHD